MAAAHDESGVAPPVVRTLTELPSTKTREMRPGPQAASWVLDFDPRWLLVLLTVHIMHKRRGLPAFLETRGSDQKGGFHGDESPGDRCLDDHAHEDP